MQKQVAKVGETYRTALVPELRSIDEKNRTIEFVSSTETQDRYGDVIRVAGWKYANYLKNPVFLWGHKSGEPPIGRTVALRTEANPPALIQTIQFATKDVYPFADVVFNLYKNGFLNAVSVGFLPLEPPNYISDLEGHTTGYEFTSQELLELSAVPIPANADCLARAVQKGFSESDLVRVFSGENLAMSSEEFNRELADISLKIADIALDVAINKVQRVLAEIKEAQSANEEVVTLDQLCDTVKAAAASVHTDSGPVPEKIEDVATLEKHLAVLPKTTDDGDNTFFGAAELLRSRSIKMRKIDEE